MIKLLSVIFSVFTLSAAWAQSDLDNVDLNDLLNIKIQSASKQAEPWAEAPVPVSIVTRDMIKLSGARTIHEALILFVPGYTDAEDRNEMVVSPRGIYATANQKVLIMVNGHRLNSRSYLTAMPDYGISLHNLERIEVLRGPGSSLYGNVALGGVINLITRKGKDFKKSSAEASAGNFEQRRLRFLTGNGGEDWDLLAWGQYFRTPGEDHTLNGNEKYNTGKTGKIYIDGVDNEPAHDWGVNYQKGNWTLFGSSRRSSYVEPYGAAANTYNSNLYTTFNEQGPGLGMKHEHLGLRYDSPVNNGWSFNFNPYYDRTEIEAILATGTNGGFAFSWQDQDVGFVTQASKSYSAMGGEGTFLFGAQVDAFEVTDSRAYSITAGDITGINTTDASPLLDRGGEEIYSLFLQEKHKFSSEWILNAGARYDYKNRQTGDNFSKVSPRAAIIYLPNATWEYKLSYSESFVDAPYWYRYQNGGLGNAFGGSVALDPEILSATQVQAVWKGDRKRNAVTVFYQKGEDIIINNAGAAGTPADPKYLNSGKLESGGVENEFAWLASSFQVFWNLSYSQAMKAENYGKFEDQFAHIPKIASSLVFNYLFTKNITANVTVKYIGEQNYNNAANITAAAVPTKVDAATIFNLGARWENAITPGLFIDGRVWNVADTTYFQGGQSQIQDPFRQSGRWWLASLGYEF